VVFNVVFGYIINVVDYYQYLTRGEPMNWFLISSNNKSSDVKLVCTEAVSSITFDYSPHIFKTCVVEYPCVSRSRSRSPSWPQSVNGLFSFMKLISKPNGDVRRATGSYFVHSGLKPGAKRGFEPTPQMLGGCSAAAGVRAVTRPPG